MLSRVRSYLRQRRALGFRLLVEGRMLENFARFADHSGHRGPLTRDLAIRWAALPKSCDRLYRARRLEVVRVLAKHLRISEPRTELPPRHLFGPAHRRPDPYVYSSKEIQKLLARAKPLAGRLRGRTYRTLLGLMACTGLRISEALHLAPDDIDLVEGVLTVRESKYRKTRLVPLHATAIGPVRDYARRRERIFPLAKAFFVSERGTPLAYRTVNDTFSRLRKGIGIGGRRAPRLHDLRHAFTCKVLLGWQKSPNGAVGRLVQLQGKGRKRRTLPLWPQTRRLLRQWIKQNKLALEAPLLPNRFGRGLTRSGAAKQLQELIGRAKAKVPSLQKRRISLHQIRHATAMHMLEAGVSAEVISLWLGHESPNTTHGYVEASLVMKKRALATLQLPKTRRRKVRLGDSLLRFLDTL
jgi:integrase